LVFGFFVLILALQAWAQQNAFALLGILVAMVLAIGGLFNYAKSRWDKTLELLEEVRP